MGVAELFADNLASIAARQVPALVLDAFAKRARTTTVKRGQVVISAGMDSNDVYLVLEGRVQAALVSPHGRETILREIGALELFGELAALGGSTRSTDVIALEASKIAVMSAAAFEALVQEEPQAAIWLARHLSHQVRRMTERVYELSSLAVSGRLHCELLRLAIERGVANGQAQIDPAPTHAELAARIGTHRESVTRELGQLAEDGIVFQTGRKLTILSIDQLVLLVRRLAAID